MRIGYAVFTVATLSFLGAGIQPPSPDWGLTITETYRLIQSGQWWPTLFPALAIASLVIATNLVADSIEAVVTSMTLADTVTTHARSAVEDLSSPTRSGASPAPCCGA